MLVFFRGGLFLVVVSIYGRDWLLVFVWDFRKVWDYFFLSWVWFRVYVRIVNSRVS